MRVGKHSAEAGRSISTADVIIIGSGFGGAVAADRLVRAGLKVSLLERGPWRRTAPVLAKGLQHAVALPIENRPGLMVRNIRAPKGPKEIRLNRRGMLEFHIGKGVKALSTSGVGGGSHIWSALVARPDDQDYWNGRAEGVSEAIMAPHYTRVAKELGAVRPTNVNTIPNHTSHAWCGSDWFETLEEDEQYPFAFLFPEQNGGRVDGDRQLSGLNGEDGMFGSPRGSKANVEAIYLLPHLDKGLTVHDMHEVLSVARRTAGGYEVIARDHRLGGINRFHAPRVVLAAGTMNSIKVLFASREAGGVNPIQCLGRGFGTNGDCLGAWIPGAPYIDSRQGSPIHGRLKVPGHPQGVNLIIGGMDVPPLPAWVPEAIRERLISTLRQRFQLIAMGVDRANGSVSFSKGRLDMRYDIDDSDVYRSIFELFDSLGERSGKPVKFDRNTAVTAHAMGGCSVGASPYEGVIDGEGRVYENEGLYISDASALPAPTGGPPSLTIAAWSSHVAASLLRNL